jgi:DNA-binding IclR family transcriptional regulator
MFCPRPIVPFRTGFFLLQRDLIVVPANRFGISDEELQLGMRAVAVPVIRDGNEILPRSGSARRTCATIYPVLQSCARMLSETIKNSG